MSCPFQMRLEGGDLTSKKKLPKAIAKHPVWTPTMSDKSKLIGCLDDTIYRTYTEMENIKKIVTQMRTGFKNIMEAKWVALHDLEPGKIFEVDLASEQPTKDVRPITDADKIQLLQEWFKEWLG